MGSVQGVFSTFFPCKAEHKWHGGMPYCIVKKNNNKKSSFLYVLTSKNLKDSENYYCFSAPLQFLHRYLRQWLKNAVRLHIFNECESNIHRYYNQCQANQEDICLCLCIKQRLEKIFCFLCFGFDLAIFTKAGPFQVQTKLVWSMNAIFFCFNITLWLNTSIFRYFFFVSGSIESY